jgi:dipeptidyl aminopeptidase/acylaminoacyl peptidase
MSDRRPITAEDLLRLRMPSEPRLAPDGSAVAFVLTEIDRERNRYVSHLWVVPTDGSGPPRQLTFASARDRSPRWSADGRRLYFISDRGDRSQLWVLPLDGGEPRALTTLPEGEVSEPLPSPDGTRVAFLYRAKPAAETKPAREEREKSGASRPPRVVRRLGYREEGTGFIGEERRRLWVVDAAGGEPQPITAGDFDAKCPCWSPDGLRIAFAANRGPDSDLNGSRDELLLLAPECGELEQVPKPEGPVRSLAWLPAVGGSGEALVFAGHDRPEEIWGVTDTHLWLAPLDGTPVRDLTPALDRPVGLYTLSDTRAVGGGAEPVSIDGGAAVAFLVADRGSTQLCRVSRCGGDVAWLTESPVEVSAVTADAAGERVVVLMGSATEPGDLYVAANPTPHPGPGPRRCPLRGQDAAPPPPPEGEGESRAPNQGQRLQAPPSLSGKGDGGLGSPAWQRVTHLHEEFRAPLQLAEPEERWVETPGGGRVHGWLLKPPGFDPARRYPLVLKIHGGPHTQYGYAFFHEFQFLAASGYLVLYGNPRGSKGYGQAWVTDLKGRWGEADLPDLMALVDDAIATGGADPKRLGVAGGSYGGFMTNWVIAHTDRFQAAVTDRCVANVLSHVGTCDFNYDDGGYFPATVAGPLPPDGYLAASPLLLAGRMHTPLLILHAEGDLRCPIEQADQLFAALRRLRRPVEYVRYGPEADHGLSRTGPPDLRLDRLERIRAWFDAHLQRRSSERADD